MTGGDERRRGRGERCDVVVVGAGVIGLTTALTLLARGLRVAVWSAHEPMATTSAVAGAIWYPFLAEPRERVLGWSRTTFAALQRFAADPASGVVMTPVVEVFATAEPDLWWAPAAGPIERLPAADVPAPFAAAVRTTVPVCATQHYLPWLVDRLRARGGELVLRRIASFDEAFAVADAVVDCAGLGAAELCGDDTLYPVRGQVAVLAGSVAHAWIDDTAARPSYVIPRGDEVVVGGTAQHHDRRGEADAGDRDAMLATAGAQFAALRTAPLRAERVGLRPCRPSVRVEREPRRDGRCLVHNYGHGGSGFTLAWGCAEEAVALVLARRD